MNTEELKQFYNELVDEYGEKVIALAQSLGISLEPDFNADDYPTDEYTEEEIAEEKQSAIEEIKDELNNIVNEYDCTYSYHREEYIVATDEEADEIEDEYLDNYIDECLEIPDNIRPYFDEEKWKDDARMDGRGHIISTYDGCEDEEDVNGTTYYIYRTN